MLVWPHPAPHVLLPDANTWTWHMRTTWSPTVLGTEGQGTNPHPTPPRARELAAGHREVPVGFGCCELPVTPKTVPSALGEPEAAGPLHKAIPRCEPACAPPPQLHLCPSAPPAAPKLSPSPPVVPPLQGKASAPHFWRRGGRGRWCPVKPSPCGLGGGMVCAPCIPRQPLTLASGWDPPESLVGGRGSRGGGGGGVSPLLMGAKGSCRGGGGSLQLRTGGAEWCTGGRVGGGHPRSPPPPPVSPPTLPVGAGRCRLRQAQR